MARFFLPPQAWMEEAWLVGDEAKHLSQVLRGRPGDQITVFDGQGGHAAAEVREVAKDRVRLALGGKLQDVSTGLHTTLAIGIPKGKTMDLVVQKAVELGVSVIQPLVTRRTIVQPGDGKADKWSRVALEACKQCGGNFLPEVLQPEEFGSWIAGAQSGLRMIASLAPGALPMREVMRGGAAPQQITVLVGPEGDFTPEETTKAMNQGFRPVTLGHSVLRTETAALFCLSVIRYEYSLNTR
jgi:16S rRNA (uracil1498-N3)-methyltransferase